MEQKRPAYTVLTALYNTHGIQQMTSHPNIKNYLLLPKTFCFKTMPVQFKCYTGKLLTEPIFKMKIQKKKKDDKKHIWNKMISTNKWMALDTDAKYRI